MLEHIGMVTFTEDAPEDIATQLEEGFNGLVGAIPGLLLVTCREDLGLKATNSSFMFRMIFEDEESWAGYFGHPAHQKVSGELVQRYTRNLAVLQVQPHLPN